MVESHGNDKSTVWCVCARESRLCTSRRQIDDGWVCCRSMAPAVLHDLSCWCGQNVHFSSSLSSNISGWREKGDCICAQLHAVQHFSNNLHMASSSSSSSSPPPPPPTSKGWMGNTGGSQSMSLYSRVGRRRCNRGGIREHHPRMMLLTRAVVRSLCADTPLRHWLWPVSVFLGFVLAGACL